MLDARTQQSQTIPRPPHLPKDCVGAERIRICKTYRSAERKYRPSAQRAGHSRCGENRVRKNFGVCHSRLGETLHVPLVGDWRSGRNNHHSDERTRLPNIWNITQRGEKAWLFGRTYHWGEGFEVRTKEGRPVEHHYLHTGPSSTTHGRKSKLWLLKCWNSRLGWGRSVLRFGFRARYERNYWKFTGKAADTTVLGDADKVKQFYLFDIYLH